MFISIYSPFSSLSRCLSIVFDLLALELCYTYYFKSIGFRTSKIGFNKSVKAGSHIDLEAEAYTMRYVAKHTSVPAPMSGVRCSGGITYILMDVVSDTRLSSAWHHISQDTKDRVIKGLYSPASSIGSPKRHRREPLLVKGGPLRDQFGPFKNSTTSFVNTPIESFGRLRGGQEVVRSHPANIKPSLHMEILPPRNVMVTAQSLPQLIGQCWMVPRVLGIHESQFHTACWISRIEEFTGEYDEQLTGERRLYRLMDTYQLSGFLVTQMFPLGQIDKVGQQLLQEQHFKSRAVAYGFETVIKLLALFST